MSFSSTGLFWVLESLRLHKHTALSEVFARAHGLFAQVIDADDTAGMQARSRLY